MLFRIFLSAALVSLFPLVAAKAQSTDCANNFSVSGNFLSGKTFRTYADLPNVAPDSGFEAAHRSLVSEGSNIQHVDKAARLLTAQERNASPGRPMPFNVHVDKTITGSRIGLSFSVPGGVFVSENEVKDEFCKLATVASRAHSTSVEGNAVKGDGTKGDSTKTRAGAPPLSDAQSSERLCVGTACLGMTLQEAVAINLQPVPAQTLAGPMAFRIGSHGVYGLDFKGNRVAFGPTRIDRNWIQKFLKSVSATCSDAALNAEMTASDGQPIRLTFSPTMVAGKAVYRLNYIARDLPRNISESEHASLVEQLEHRYGDAFSYGWKGLAATNAAFERAKTHPHVTLKRDVFILELPYEDVRTAIMEQPGCSAKVSID